MPETTIAWENGDASWSRSIAQPGKYWYEVSNRCGVWRDTFLITEDSAPKSVLPKQMNLCNGSNAMLDGTQIGKGKYQYLWEDGSKVPTSWVSGSSLKILKTWNLCGSINDTVNVVFGECNCSFWVPNAFTPRASVGKNDGWKPVFNCAADATFSIYSRWGSVWFGINPSMCLGMGITWVIWFQTAFIFISYMVNIPVARKGGRGWIRAVQCWF